MTEVSVSPAVPAPRQPAQRIHGAFTASAERRLLEWIAQRTPTRINSDHLTALGFLGQLGAALSYAAAGQHRGALLLVNLCLCLNWLGDSLDGTLARVRRQQRPRFGFYVDHMADVFGSTALMAGLGASRLVHWPVAVGMGAGFLLLASESFLAASTLCRFEMSQAKMGPTELRLLLMAGNFALLRSPFATVFGQRWLLFDLGGSVGAAGMLVLALTLTIRHTAELYREEPLSRA